MKSRWTFRCYPTPDQELHLACTFGCVRYVWNWALQLRMDAWRDGERISYPETDRRLTLLKKQPETAWLNDVSSVCLQQALRDLQVAFSNFFNKRAASPNFKRKEARQSANYSKGGFAFDVATHTLKLAKIGPIRVKWSRDSIPSPSSVRLIRTASGKYFVSLVVETLPAPLPETGETVGIDFGINRLATLSTGEVTANPQHGAKHQRRLSFLQHQLARKKDKISKRRQKLKRQIARVHEKIANSRTDTLHKFSTDMVRRFDVIYIEDLNVRGMVTNHNLARALIDASLGTAARMLEEKAERYGKKVERIGRFFPSSKACSCCGHILQHMPLDVRNWTCPACGKGHDRDVNAALNILAAGQAVTAHKGTVRRTAAKAAGRKSPRSANRQAAVSG